MPYLNFTKIAPPAPNDPLVNEVTHLNNNWDHLEAKLAPYSVGGLISGMETGQEAFDGSFNFVVANGVGVTIPDDITQGWSAWTNLPMAAGRSIRAGFQPKWRNNPLYRMVELTGGVQYDGAAAAWPASTNVLINADSAGSPPLSMLPIGGKHVQKCAAALTTAPAIVAGGHVIVENPGGTSAFTRIGLQYLGGPGGGNFIMLDQVWWWY